MPLSAHHPGPATATAATAIATTTARGPRAGDISCSTCPAGHVSTEGSTQCEACAAGRISTVGAPVKMDPGFPRVPGSPILKRRKPSLSKSFRQGFVSDFMSSELDGCQESRVPGSPTLKTGYQIRWACQRQGPTVLFLNPGAGWVGAMGWPWHPQEPVSPVRGSIGGIHRTQGAHAEFVRGVSKGPMGAWGLHGGTCIQERRLIFSEPPP